MFALVLASLIGFITAAGCMTLTVDHGLRPVLAGLAVSLGLLCGALAAVLNDTNVGA